MSGGGMGSGPFHSVGSFQFRFPYLPPPPSPNRPELKKAARTPPPAPPGAPLPPGELLQGLRPDHRASLAVHVKASQYGIWARASPG